MLGLIFVIVGILMLLERMDVISGGFWEYLWPVVLIVFGFSLIDKHKSNLCGCFGGSKQHGKKKHEGRKIVDEQ
ncbi:hypothetical protein HOB10_03485 [Candidatus Parcubacteria bacterium]|jgi:hypothetical protein|nr:hypothetical protein [Candidatus Parcubacteria bacterium]